jgi:hypothetical protein
MSNYLVKKGLTLPVLYCFVLNLAITCDCIRLHTKKLKKIMLTYFNLVFKKAVQSTPLSVICTHKVQITYCVSATSTLILGGTWLQKDGRSLNISKSRFKIILATTSIKMKKPNLVVRSCVLI